MTLRARAQAFTASLAVLGRQELSLLAELGAVTRFFLAGLGGALSLSFRMSAAVEQYYLQGVKTFRLILVAAFFVGMVLAVQTAVALERFGISVTVADIVCASLVRELAPVFTALLLAGRAGSGIAAELSSMSITEQVAAMRMLGLSVQRLVVVPRIVGAALAGFSLCVIFDLVGILGGLVVAVYQLDLPFHEYANRTWAALPITDIAVGLIKATIFGLVIGVVGCYAGLSARGGAKGVGRATTQAVVSASVVVLVSDFFLTRLLILWLG